MKPAGRTGGAVAIVLLALAARLIGIWCWSGYDIRETVDEVEYVALAQNLLRHGTLSFGTAIPDGVDRSLLDVGGPYKSSAERPPLYPMLVAALWWHDTPPLLAVRLVQAALGAGVALMAYLIALEAFGRRAALIAGLAVALAPFTIYATVLILTETLFTFLLTTSAWFWMRKRMVISGLLLGAATLTRAVGLPLIGAVLLVALLTKFNRAAHLKLALAALIVVAPWALRNAITQNSFVLVASTGWGANLLLGTIDVPYSFASEWDTFNQDEGYIGIVKCTATTAETESQMLRLAAQRIAHAPVDWLWVRVKQFPRFWVGGGPVISYRTAVTYAFILGGVVFWALAAAGMALGRARWRELYPLAFFPFLLAATYFVGAVEERYSVPLVPMGAIFAGYALDAGAMALDRIKRKSSRWR